MLIVQLLIWQGLKDLAEEDFKNAIYMIDIGQNDIANEFSYLSKVSQVLEKIPSFISEIQAAVWVSLFSLG